MRKSSSSYSCCGIIILSIYYCIYYSFSNFTNVEGFDSLLRLPFSESAANRDRLLSRTVFYVNDYGAKGDGIHDDTQAFKEAWRLACDFPTKTKIVIRAGKNYLVRPIDFGGPCKAKLKFRISGTIIAPNNPSAWDGLNPQKWLYFNKVDHLTVDGRGKIDGRGQGWWARSCKVNTSKALTFHRCNNLKVKKITMVNSQQVHLAFTNCAQVEVSEAKVLAPGSSPNTDGIHISSSTLVEIRDTAIGTGDDCISIVGNSSDILISNITCGPGHGISIGSLGKSNSSAVVHDVIVDGAVLSNTANGLRIKTWQSLAVKVENISFVAIKGTSATEEAMRFACSDSFPCESLYLQDVQIVSYFGGYTSAFCWKALGSFSGLIYPPPCFMGNANKRICFIAINLLIIRAGTPDELSLQSKLGGPLRWIAVRTPFDTGLARAETETPAIDDKLSATPQRHDRDRHPLTDTASVKPRAEFMYKREHCGSHVRYRKSVAVRATYAAAEPP
ncbi:pectin lyase-like superfamily protein [Actinidia rufa]|uniref:Pectin lyase-like superfamily protein n=1 Tax=Actinidia rufa TaxID=165716 RepID=A0A7J0FE72_9ERIC|nr:pectin lyase-like superfamily protein [Actinidia rufa]